MASVLTPPGVTEQVKVANFSVGSPASVGIRKGAYIVGVRVHTGAASVDGVVDVGYDGGAEIVDGLDTSTSTNEMYGTNLLDQDISLDRNVTALSVGANSGPFLLVVHYVDSLNK